MNEAGLLCLGHSYFDIDSKHHSLKSIRQYNRGFYDHFWVDDIVFTGIFGSLEIVLHSE